MATAHTSCGFATDDYNLWPAFTWLLLLIAMLSGGCTGSTSGGIKNMRLLIIARSIRNEFKHLLHPNAVLPVRVNKQTVSPSIVSTVGMFFLLFILSSSFLVGQFSCSWVSAFPESIGTVISVSVMWDRDWDLVAQPIRGMDYPTLPSGYFHF